MNNLEDLLARTALRDQKAFEQLYSQTSPRLYGMAVQMLQQRDLAEEVLQEAFTKIWYSADKFRADQGSALSWMVSIVRYRAIDIIRANNSRITTVNNETVEEIIQESKADPLEDNLEGCMDSLQEQQKRTVMLAFYHGYTHNELAQKLAVPIGTLKSWVRRGLDKLRRCLDAIYESDLDR